MDGDLDGELGGGGDVRARSGSELGTELSGDEGAGEGGSGGEVEAAFCRRKVRGAFRRGIVRVGSCYEAKDEAKESECCKRPRK